MQKLEEKAQQSEIKDLITPEKPEKAKRQRKAKKSTQAVEPNCAVFPREAKINAYGLLFLDQHVQEALGISRGKNYPVELNRQGDLLTVQLKK